MKRITLPIAAAALVLGTTLLPAQPAGAKTVLEMLDSAYNTVRRQANPTSGYGNLYGNFYGAPYGYPYGYPAQQQTSSPWLSGFTDRYLGTGTTGQYIYDPYTGNYVVNPNYAVNSPSIGSRVRSYIVREVINRVF